MSRKSSRSRKRRRIDYLPKDNPKVKSKRGRNSTPSRNAGVKKAKSKKGLILPIILLVMSLLVMAYPFVATLHNNNRHAEISDSYRDKVSVSPWKDTNEKDLREAREYNEWLKRNPIEPSPIGKESSHPDYPRYQSLLNNPENTMATITIPRVGIDLPVYHGTSAETLKKGAGHLHGTSLPVGGKGNMSAISAHTGMVNASMFDNLINMREGDKAHILVRGEELTYQAVDIRVVPPDDTHALDHNGQDDTLMLITCTPYGLNTDRLIVEMVRVDNEGDFEDVTNDIGIWTWWMTLLCVLAVIELGLVVILVRKWRAIKDSGGDNQ